MDGANVRSIQGVEDLASALQGFSAKGVELLHETEQEIARTQQWLASRMEYWAREERYCQQKQRQVGEELRHLKTIPGSSNHAPSQAKLAEYDRAYRGAAADLEHARAQYRTAAHWHAAIDQAAANYRRQARGLSAMLHHEVAKAITRLRRKVELLKLYLAVPQAGSATPIPITPSDQPTASMTSADLALSHLPGPPLTQRTVCTGAQVSIRVCHDTPPTLADTPTIDAGNAQLLFEQNTAMAGCRCKLLDLAVLPEAQQQGIGSAMLEQAEQVALRTGASEIYGIAPANEATRRWFELRGYRLRNDGAELYKPLSPAHEEQS